MSVVKEKMKQIIESFPEDATYDEIMRELFFDQMIERGLDDVRNKQVISNKQMEQRIRSWKK